MKEWTKLITLPVCNLESGMAATSKRPLHEPTLSVSHLWDQSARLNIMRDPESVDGVEHVVRARGKAFDLRGDFPVVDRFDLDLALVVGVALPRRDLVFVH